MSQAQIEELRKIRGQLKEADNYAGVWLHRVAELEDKRQRLRNTVCGVKENAHHRWEIDHIGNELVHPNSRAFCENCGDVKYID